MAATFKSETEFNQKYEIKEELGRGRYGVVYKCFDHSNRPYAAKYLFKQGKCKVPREDVEREASILLGLTHPMILQMVDVFETRTEWILLTELLKGCELFDYVASQDFLVEREAVLYIRNILEAVKYLHQQNICHLDIKPENIMLEDPVMKKIKLIDFGVARRVSNGQKVSVMVGTPEFAAPEVLNYDPISTAADLWSVGVLTYTLLSGASPFLGDDDGETMQNVIEGELDFPDEFFSSVSAQAKSFIEGLLVLEPSQRETAASALKNPWLLTKAESKIDLTRFRALKAHRKWQAALKTIKLSLSLCRQATRKSISKLSTSSSVSSIDNDH